MSQNRRKRGILIDNKKVYRHSFGTAVQNDELAAYYESSELNASCASAMDKAISESNYELYHYDCKTAAQRVVLEYGIDRVSFVAASIVQAHPSDGRYSRENKEWAKSFPIQPEQPVVCNTHPVVLDGFIKEVRKMLDGHEKVKSGHRRKPQQER